MRSPVPIAGPSYNSTRPCRWATRSAAVVAPRHLFSAANKPPRPTQSRKGSRGRRRQSVLRRSRNAPGGRVRRRRSSRGRTTSPGSVSSSNSGNGSSSRASFSSAALYCSWVASRCWPPRAAGRNSGRGARHLRGKDNRRCNSFRTTWTLPGAKHRGGAKTKKPRERYPHGRRRRRPAAGAPPGGRRKKTPRRSARSRNPERGRVTRSYEDGVGFLVADVGLVQERDPGAVAARLALQQESGHGVQDRPVGRPAAARQETRPLTAVAGLGADSVGGLRTAHPADVPHGGGHEAHQQGAGGQAGRTQKRLDLRQRVGEDRGRTPSEAGKGRWPC